MGKRRRRNPSLWIVLLRHSGCGNTPRSKRAQGLNRLRRWSINRRLGKRRRLAYRTNNARFYRQLFVRILGESKVSSPPRFTTLGCRLNAYETEVMKELANQAGLRDTIVINTCAVTAEAVRKSRRQIRKLYRDNPRASIIVTGCAAQIDPKSFSKMPEVASVLGLSLIHI